MPRIITREVIETSIVGQTVRVTIEVASEQTIGPTPTDQVADQLAIVRGLQDVLGAGRIDGDAWSSRLVFRQVVQGDASFRA